MILNKLATLSLLKRKDVNFEKVFKLIIFGMLTLMTLSSPVMAKDTEIEPRKGTGNMWANTPRTVELDCSDFSGVNLAAIERAMDTWNDVESIHGGPIVTLESSSSWNTDGVIKKVTDSRAPLGLMTPGVGVGGYLDDVEITVNYYYSIVVGAAVDCYDIQSIVTHELGHALGVAHCHEEGERCTSPTCSTNAMNPICPDNSIIRRVLSAYDSASYQYVYR